MSFIKSTWKWILASILVLVLAYNGITINIDNSSRADSRSFSVSDSAAYALSFTWINSQGKDSVNLPNYEWKTIVQPLCAKKTLWWCSTPGLIDYKSLDANSAFWYAFSDIERIIIRALVRKTKNTNQKSSVDAETD